MFRLVKQYKLPISDLIQIYIGYIRPVLEYCVPVFNGSLTLDHVQKLERIQKRVCKIILGNSYLNYEDALKRCKLDTLKDRREQLCYAFAVSVTQNPHCKNWLPERPDISMILRNKHKYMQYRCRTSRFKQSAIPYFINLLNNC